MARKMIALTVVSAALFGGSLACESAFAAPPGPAANPVIVYLNRDGAIEVANVDGSAKTVLRTNGSNRRPTWAPGGDGTTLNPWHIVYEYTICNQLKQFTLVKTNSGGLTAGSDVDISTSFAGQACAVDISPVADRLVFGEGPTEPGFLPSSLWTMNVNGGSEFDVKDAPDGSTITWATYNSDGTKIAFAIDGPSSSSIETIDSNGANLAPVLSTGGRFLEWSPDGHFLAFSAGGGSSVEGVYILDMITPGSTPVRLVSGSGATWSADNSQLAFNATTGVSVIDISTHKITSLVKGAHHPKFRNANMGSVTPALLSASK